MSEREQTENRITLSLELREACEENQKIATAPMRSELLEKEIFFSEKYRATTKV